MKDNDFDETIRQRFEKAYHEVVLKFKDGKLDALKSGEDALACVIVLDQFSRNMFRDIPKAFATDDLALTISKMAVDKGLNRELSSAAHHNFLYMPFMHSENLDDQEEGIRLFSLIPRNEKPSLTPGSIGTLSPDLVAFLTGTRFWDVFQPLKK